MLMEESYSTAFLAEVLFRLLPERVKGNEINPRRAALLVVKKVVVEEIPGKAFFNALYWALRFLRKIKAGGDQFSTSFEISCLVAGLKGALVDFFSDIDQVETAMNYELPDWE